MSFTSAGKPEFHYYIKDHLGSIRVVCDRNGNAEQVNHYYPYGGLIGDLSTDDNKQKYRYKYNGKEMDRMYGLDTYDYGARQYNPARITWDRMDQYAEKYYHLNPYLYCAGNPIRYVDNDGREIIDKLITKNDEEESIKQGYIENTHDKENAIILIAHGEEHGSGIVITDKNNGTKNIVMPYDTEVLLDNNSEIWKTRFLTGNQPDLILLSCETGKPSKFAQRISADESFKDIKIYAPDNIARISSDGRCTIDEGGNWNEYINGELTNKYSGSLVPGTKEFEDASYWDKLVTDNMIWQNKQF